MRCVQCGAEMAQGASFCSRCGARLHVPRPGAPREFALLRVWPSWWEFTRQSVAALMLILGGLYLLFTHREAWGWVPVLWVLGFGALVSTAITRRRISWSITSERLIERSGIVATRERHMELADIRSVEIAQTASQKMLGLGDVVVASAASSDFAIRLKSIADPHGVAEKIRQARLKRLG
jgi:membrane protein YdbS with pleckstrin-like domain